MCVAQIPLLCALRPQVWPTWGLACFPAAARRLLQQVMRRPRHALALTAVCLEASKGMGDQLLSLLDTTLQQADVLQGQRQLGVALLEQALGLAPALFLRQPDLFSLGLLLLAQLLFALLLLLGEGHGDGTGGIGGGSAGERWCSMGLLRCGRRQIASSAAH